MFKDQSQEVKEGGTAVQAGRDVNFGISYADARDIALDVFRANFYQLSKEAMTVAENRATEITDTFLKKLQEENPNGFAKGQDPDFQHALFTTQKEYARTGDKELGDLLVDLLVDRSKQDERAILQIVLNESLATAPKLTSSQFACLSIMFLFKYTQNYDTGNHTKFGEYLDKFVKPLVPNLINNRSSFQHLAFTGCGSSTLGEQKLANILAITYQGQFLKGFDKSEIEERGITIGNDHRFFMQCLNNPEKLQIRANSLEILNSLLGDSGCIPEDMEKIRALFTVNSMTHEEIAEKVIEIRPYMKNVFDVWDSSEMASFVLTSVGICIAHANLKKIIGEFANLDIWIN
jgi:hypothetical protein